MVETSPRAPAGGTEIPFICDRIRRFLLVVGGFVFLFHIGSGTMSPQKGGGGEYAEPAGFSPRTP